MSPKKQRTQRGGKAPRGSPYITRSSQLVYRPDPDASDCLDAASANLSRSTSSDPQFGTASAQAQTPPAAQNAHKKTRPVFSGAQEVITIYVGLKTENPESRKKFVVHKEFACHYSQFFKIAFTSDSIESESQSMELQDVEEEVFALFVHWLYTQRITNAEDAFPAAQLLIKLWLLAEKLLVPELQNQAVDMIERQRAATGVVSTDMLWFIYGHTVAGSPLRRLIVDHCAFYLGSEFFTLQEKDEYTRESLFDIVSALLKYRETRQRSRPPTEMNSYHVETGAEHQS